MPSQMRETLSAIAMVMDAIRVHCAPNSPCPVRPTQRNLGDGCAPWGAAADNEAWVDSESSAYVPNATPQPRQQYPYYAHGGKKPTVSANRHHIALRVKPKISGRRTPTGGTRSQVNLATSAPGFCTSSTLSERPPRVRTHSRGGRTCSRCHKHDSSTYDTPNLGRGGADEPRPCVGISPRNCSFDLNQQLRQELPTWCS